MGWVPRLVETGADGSSRSVDVMAIDCPGDLGDIAALTLSQGKRLVALVQQEIVTAQSRNHAVRRLRWTPLVRQSGWRVKRESRGITVTTWRIGSRPAGTKRHPSPASAAAPASPVQRISRSPVGMPRPVRHVGNHRQKSVLDVGSAGVRLVCGSGWWQ
jgi:hypothetical protein